MRFLVVLVALCAVAHAEPRVVVLDFAGKAPTELRSDVVRVLKKDLFVVSLEKWTKTAKQLSATKPTPANVRKVAAKLRIDAVVEGTATPKRGGYALQLRVLAGSSGKSVATANLETEKEALGKTAKRAVAKVVVAKIESL